MVCEDTYGVVLKNASSRTSQNCTLASFACFSTHLSSGLERDVKRLFGVAGTFRGPSNVRGCLGIFLKMVHDFSSFSKRRRRKLVVDTRRQGASLRRRKLTFVVQWAFLSMFRTVEYLVFVLVRRRKSH